MAFEFLKVKVPKEWKKIGERIQLSPKHNNIKMLGEEKELWKKTRWWQAKWCFPSNVYILTPKTYEYVMSQYKEELRFLRWKIILVYPGGLNLIKRVLKNEKEAEELESEKMWWWKEKMEWCDCCLWRWDGATGRGMQAACGWWKRQRSSFLPRVPRKNTALIIP